MENIENLKKEMNLIMEKNRPKFVPKSVGEKKIVLEILEFEREFNNSRDEIGHKLPFSLNFLDLLNLEQEGPVSNEVVSKFGFSLSDYELILEDISKNYCKLMVKNLKLGQKRPCIHLGADLLNRLAPQLPLFFNLIINPPIE